MGETAGEGERKIESQGEGKESFKRRGRSKVGASEIALEAMLRHEWVPGSVQGKPASAPDTKPGTVVPVK